jgi:Na+/H+-dicarboxylate symporter
LVPTNPIKAAADGAMLPLIIFTIVFAMAVTRIPETSRTTFLNFARALRDASLTLVRWILVVAPIGVFGLTLSVALKMGAAAAGAVAFYIVLVCALCVVFMAVLYVVAFVASGDRRFPARWAESQLVGFSSRASMVALPAMINASEALGQPLVVRSFFLPLAVAMFRAGAAINIPIGVLFIAQLYGVPVSAAQLVTIVLMAVVTTFTIPSVPGGTIIVMVPVMLAAGLPVEGVGILLAIDTLPDMFRTATHVTADLTVASIIAKASGAAAA